MAHQGLIAKCPYFARENQTTIFCEQDRAFCAGAEYRARIFGNAAEKRAYIRAHCGRYPDMQCDYAKYMDESYGGKEE